VLGIGIFADTWISSMPTVPPPRRSPVLERHAAGPLLEVPPGNGYEDLGAMYRGIFHHRLVGNGYSGFFPPHYLLLIQNVAAMDPDLPVQLATLGFREVSVNRGLDVGHRLETFFGGAPGVERVAGDDHDVLFRLPPAAPRAVTSEGTLLKVAALRANVNEKLVDRMLDGDLQTRWDAGIQKPGQELVIDLGSIQRVDTVSLALGPYITDFARLLSLEVSDDGQTWNEVWKGPTAAMALLASVSDPKVAALRLPVGRATRWIRLMQHGSDKVFYWSIAELRIW
jgi:hypothetical protein